jgi:hypothetical protein
VFLPSFHYPAVKVFLFSPTEDYLDTTICT